MESANTGRGGIKRGVRGGGRRARGCGVSHAFSFSMPQGDDHVPPVPQVPLAVAPVPGPSQPMISRSMAEEQEKIEKLGALDQINMAHLMKKHRAWFLQPDAPPCKKSRRVSPDCMSLMPETPRTSPPPTPQTRQKRTPDASEPSRVVLDDVDTPPRTTGQLDNAPSTEVIILNGDVVLDENLIIDTNIELIGFSPRSTSPSHLPVASTSTAEPEPSTYGEDDAETRRCDRTGGVNTGSDVEDGDDAGSDVKDGDDVEAKLRDRDATEFRAEDLSSELRQTLASIDRVDDSALREFAGQDMLHFDWSHDPTVFCGQREKFVGPAGPTFQTEGMSPFQILRKIWDEDIINLIVTETNKYAESLRSNPENPQHARIKKWFSITADELWTFFGLLMLQSIIPIPVEHEYWSPCLNYLKIGNFTEIMPFHRFEIIKRCLHFVDNKLCARDHTKLMKIKPILDHLNSRFSSLYLPEQNISIDESLLLWTGRLSFAQLIKNKAAQTGIKSYELCESRTGYLWQMLIYVGKDGGHKDGDAGQAEPEGATSRIVYSLVRPLLNKGHTLVMDNFYNSPLLARTLKAQKTDVLGTLRLHREFVPESLRHKDKSKMQSGEVAFSHTKDLTITVWKDANVVSLISTYHAVQAGGKFKHGYYKYKPTVVLDYNLSMGGVDKKDQLLQAFPLERIKNAMWYKKVFRRLLNISIHNSFVMFTSAGTVDIAQRQFRVQLADEIIQRFRPLSIQKPLSGHYPARNNSKKLRCQWCARLKKVRCTVYKCDTCNVNLCVIGCFRDFHIYTYGRST